ncbi:uncharacterized protein LOC114516964 [Dendronephthya gigantea]|uniref:uncharacterized protein LOC114516964 n=1 Tax=Dendronephthya gigantea TaxID=151771 RepID=UPI0010699D55|nr:uncharacterized protein LOC114516964 [Dendronephthya gigantea]
MKVEIASFLVLLLVVLASARTWDRLFRFYDQGDISQCEREGEDYCECEKYFEGIEGQGCSEGRHNCDDSRTCNMNHQWHACCLDEEEAESERDEPSKIESEVKNNEENKFEDSAADISQCENDEECKCEKYLEGIPGEGCSEGRHNCDDSRSCYMNHPWHACCLD